MPITIGSNISSLRTQRMLSRATDEISSSYNRLSSGLRINSAKDDAAGLAIADDLKTRTRVYSQAIINANHGQSLLSIADSTVNNLSEVVTRIRELATQSANGALSQKQRQSLDAEAQALSKEFFRISRSASYNGINLFDGSLSTGLRLQLGYGVEGSIQSSLGGKLGNGEVQSIGSISTEPTNSEKVLLKDLNGDGILDLVTAGSNAGLGQITISLGVGDGTFGASTSYQSGSDITDMKLSDINNDGILDIITSSSNQSSSVVTRLGRGDGTFGNTTTYSGIFNASIELADLNNDGILDIVSSGGGGVSGVYAVNLGTGGGGFSQQASFGTGHANDVTAISLGDLNGDGILDLVTAEGTRGGVLRVYVGNGNGTFGAGDTYAISTSGIDSVILADFNDDGILDVVTDGGTEFLYRQGMDNGTFGSVVTFSGLDTIISELQFADMNGDGNLDLIAAGRDRSNPDGYLSIYLGTGTGSFGAETTFVSDSQLSRSVAVGDINNDGVLDAVTAGRTDANAGSATIFTGKTREGIAPLLSFSLLNKSDALQSLGMLERAHNNLLQQRGVIGAFQSRVNIAINTLASSRENFQAAESRIRDMDVAEESSTLIRTQILQQSAIAVLGQANLLPQLALKLLT